MMTQMPGQTESGENSRESNELDPRLVGSVDQWLDSLRGVPPLGELLGLSAREQVARGYGHTLREICQQPVTWPETAQTLVRRADSLRELVAGVGAVVLTGSGSSFYAAQCAAPCLHEALSRHVTALPTGRILTHPEICLPPSGPYLVVSLARSGDSPESCAAVDQLLEAEPRAQHLVVTCNQEGALATSYADNSNVHCIVLDEKTNDQSLVMTSSFTNMVLATRGLASLDAPERFASRALALAGAGARVLAERSAGLAAAGGADSPGVVFLGSGCRLGSAREAALKTLEMTAGEVQTLADSYLGLRHGPMSALRKDTLVVAFLSSDPTVRAYEADLLRELDLKELGRRRVVVGAGIPDEIARTEDLVVDCGPEEFSDADLTIVDVLVGQLLAFFRCRALGLRPDSPSVNGVITRVVSAFKIHSRNGAG